LKAVLINTYQHTQILLAITHYFADGTKVLEPKPTVLVHKKL